MFRKITFVLSILLLTACISVSVETPPAVTQNGFVTSTLPPTKPAYIPLTLTPTPMVVTVTPTIAITIPANCQDGAVLFRDVTIPDETKINAGEKFTKTWEFQNVGTCPWVNYTIKFAAGDRMGAPLSALIPVTLSNTKVEISVELTAPAADGTYTGYFTLNNVDGKDLVIGVEKTFWVKIIVGSGASSSSPTGATSVP